MTLSKGSLFEPKVVADLINKVKGRSSVTQLSGMEPVSFNGQTEFTFTMDSDIDIVAENGEKTHGGVTIKPHTTVPLKVEYGARVSSEFMFASAEEKIDLLKAFNDGYAKKLARGLDLMVFHGINPRSGKPSSLIGDNSFDTGVTQTIEFKEADPDGNIEDAVSVLQASDGVVSGMAIDPKFSSALAHMRDGNNNRLFPELAWGANPGSINGIPTDINNTVGNGNKDLGILGDFKDMFKWGYSKQIPMRVIEYGDPDNSGLDLQGHNQVYLRSETFLGWSIMDTNSFARVIKPAAEA